MLIKTVEMSKASSREAVRERKSFFGVKKSLQLSFTSFMNHDHNDPSINILLK